MSVELNTDYQKYRNRKEIMRDLNDLYQKRSEMTDADIFHDNSIIDFDDVIKLTTGQKIGSFSAFKRSNIARARNIAQTERLADLLEEGGIKARIDDGNKLYMKTHITEQLREIPKYRNINFLPSVAQRNRRDMMKDFEYFMTTDERMKNARYFVITSGKRFQFDNKKDSLKNKTRDFNYLLQRFRNEICKEFEVEVIFQGIEFPRDDDASYHIHANVVILPPQHMISDTSEDEDTSKNALEAYNKFYIASQDFLPHFEDNGRIKSLKEFVKYPFKPAELANIESEEAVWLYHNTFNTRMMTPLAGLAEFCKTRKEQKLRIVRIGSKLHLRSSNTLIVENKPNKDKKEDKSAPKALKNHVLGVMTPGFYAVPYKESATLIINYDKDDKSTTNLVIDADALHKAQSREAWRENNAPAPRQALALAAYIKNADFSELEEADELNRVNVHSTTISSNLSEDYKNDLIEDDADPPPIPVEAATGIGSTQDSIKNKSTSKETSEICSVDFLAIFDELQSKTEKYYFRNELVERDVVEAFLSDTI